MKIRANNIDVEVVDSAPDAPHLPVVLLVMGLGMQLIAWPPGLVRALMNAGYRVIRFDNRDSGLSDKFDALGMPNLLWQGLKYKLGLSIKPPYSVHDMALDTLGVLDAWMWAREPRGTDGQALRRQREPALDRGLRAPSRDGSPAAPDPAGVPG